MPEQRTGGLNRRICLALVALLIVCGILWHTWLVYPLKILVVFFHELSHGFAAVLTGGTIERIELAATEGGLCVTRGGSRFVVLSAGYLGSLLWGGAILLLAARTRYDRPVAMGLGFLLAAVALLYVRPVASFGFAFVILVSAGLMLASVKLSTEFNDFLLKLIGLVSCMYVPLDVASDVLARPTLPSDAAMLAALTGVPTIAWGLLWITLAVLAGGYFLVCACTARSSRGPSPDRVRRLNGTGR